MKFLLLAAVALSTNAFATGLTSTVIAERFEDRYFESLDVENIGDFIPSETIYQKAVAPFGQVVCQTAAEITAHLGGRYRQSVPESFCFHNVTNPALGLATGYDIAKERQLAANLEVAFLNKQKKFADAQVACASIGSGWHAPLLDYGQANPRATSYSNSLDGVGEYFIYVASGDFWSESAVAYNTDHAYFVNLWHGYSYGHNKDKNSGVVCVRP